MKICKMALVDLIYPFTGDKNHKPFECIKNVAPGKLLLALQQEHPQTIACVLAHLKPRKAAVILKGLPNETQGEVTRRITTLDKISPDILCEVDKALEKELAAVSDNCRTERGGLKGIAKILKSAGKAISTQILKGLENDDPELVEAVREEMGKKFHSIAM
jgi:flagellar motor switch protein FliG